MNPTRLRPTTLAALALAGAASMATSPAYWGTSASAKLATIDLAPGAEVTRAIVVVPELELATENGRESWQLFAPVILADTATAATIAIALVEDEGVVFDRSFTVTATSADETPVLSAYFERPRTCAPCGGSYSLRIANRSDRPLQLREPELHVQSEAPLDPDMGSPKVHLLVAE